MTSDTEFLFRGAGSRIPALRVGLLFELRASCKRLGQVFRIFEDQGIHEVSHAALIWVVTTFSVPVRPRWPAAAPRPRPPPGICHSATEGRTPCIVHRRLHSAASYPAPRKRTCRDIRCGHGQSLFLNGHDSRAARNGNQGRSHFQGDEGRWHLRR